MVFGSQGVPKSFIFIIRYLKWVPRPPFRRVRARLCVLPCVFECVCMIFLFLLIFFGTAMLSLQPPSTGMRSKYRHHQRKPTTAAKQMLPADASIICRTSITSKTRHRTHHRHCQANPAEPAVPAKPVLPAESVSLAEASGSSITSRRQPHQQKQVSPAEAIITSTTSRTRHDKQHRQSRPKPAEPADASISSRASFTSRKPPQNHHQNTKKASLAKTGRNKHPQ